MATLITKSELARLAGVSPAAITKGCRASFPAAMVGPRVDLDHPETKAYLARRAYLAPLTTSAAATEPATPTTLRPLVAVASSAPETQATAPTPSAADPHRGTTGDDVARYAHMSLDELTRMFGTATAFVDWLQARKRISDLRARDTQHAEHTGRLIERQFVAKYVFGALEGLFKRLLADTAITITRRVYALARSNTPIEEAEQLVRDLIGAQLKETKAHVARALQAQTKEEPAKAS